jgi:N-formylglutamate deformylase
MPTTFTFQKGLSPIVATAIHDGHQTRDNLTPLFNLTDAERLREEDPFTARWTGFTDNTIVVHHSRFEVDVNRPKDKAVYMVPGDAWGLQVWKQKPSDDVLQESLKLYDSFYSEAKRYFDALFVLHENIIVYDIHSYNHCRDAKNVFADPEDNPEINIGTQNMDTNAWHPLVQALIDHCKSFDFNGRHLDVRENVKFKGGYFGKWLYEQYGNKICPISIEFKKFFMDEWTGEGNEKDINLVLQMLASSTQPVLRKLEKTVHI